MIDYIQYFVEMRKDRYKVSDDGVDADLLYDIDCLSLGEGRPENNGVYITTQKLDIDIYFDKHGVPNEVTLDFSKYRNFNQTITFKRTRKSTDIWEKDQSKIKKTEVIHYALWDKIKHFFKKSN